MKIYFAGSIRGGREDAALYMELIQLLQAYGTVLTEHVGDAELSEKGESLTHTSEYIYTRDVAWIDGSDYIVAEITIPSMGVGYEIGYGEHAGKPILCLYREREGKMPSSMIVGNSNLRVERYETLEDAGRLFKTFLV